MSKAAVVVAEPAHAAAFWTVAGVVAAAVTVYIHDIGADSIKHIVM